MIWDDVPQLTWAVLAVFLPGTVLLAVGLRRPWVETVAVAPAVTVTICYITALVTGLLGLSWGTVAVAVGTILLTAAALLVRRRWFGGPLVDVPSMADLRRWAIPGGGVLAAVGIGLWQFDRGFERLGVLPQEHDVVAHTLITARIERSGEAAPWDSAPVDLLSGAPEGFYPNGLHMLASLAAPGPADTVAALNAVTVVLAAIVLPVGMAALAGRLAPPQIRPAGAAAAALVGVLAYRPIFAFLHDGGVLANLAAFVFTPGVLFAALAAAAGVRSGALVTVALGLVGAVVTHPVAAPTIGITAAVWIVAAVLLARPERQVAIRTIGYMAAAAFGAVVILLPLLLGGAGATSAVTGFPRDTSQTSLGDALSLTLSFYYGGYYDFAFQLSQTTFAVLSLVGVVLCLYMRTNLALLISYAAWLVIVFLWLLRPSFPFIELLGGVYYSSVIRLTNALTVLQWLTIAVAVGYAALGVTRVAGALLARWRAGRPSSWVPAVGHVGVVLAFLLLVLGYSTVNAETLRERYAAPEFTRVDGDDLAAARWLADNVEPGQRVMNNANDGSTYGYVFYGIPIVQSSTLGAPGEPYTVELLLRFDDLEYDREIQEIVCDLEIAWVVADAEAPTIGAGASVTPLGTDGLYTTPPGFQRLSTVTVLEQVFQSGDVTVYEVDLDALRCGDAG